jgi:hypothetical protein
VLRRLSAAEVPGVPEKLYPQHHRDMFPDEKK